MAENGTLIDADDYQNVAEKHTQDLFGLTWSVLIVIFVTFRLSLHVARYIRTLASMGHDKQDYFREPTMWFAHFKRYIYYAPLFHKRHHREFRMSTALNIGTAPSRMQTVFLVLYTAANAVVCIYDMDLNTSLVNTSNALIMRTGVLAVVNMVPLFVFSFRNNPLIWMFGISFDTFNLMHRWFGRLVVAEALTHGLVYTFTTYKLYGWSQFESFGTPAMVNTGLVGISAMLLIIVQASSVLRHAFYETFLHVHQILVVTILASIWIHLEGYGQQMFFVALFVLWGTERVLRVYTMVRNSRGLGGTKAEIECMPGEALRVTLRIARPWKFEAGQHIYLYIPSIGWWTSHPFSLAWSEEDKNVYDSDGLPSNMRDVLSLQKTTMSLIIRRRTGFTDKLWLKAEAAPKGVFTTTAIVEGPYGSESLGSYGTVMLFAAGVGITHQVPHVRALIAARNNNTCATRKVVLVWIIQSPEHLEWIRPWMTNIMNMEGRREVLKILLFITRPKNTQKIQSPSASVQMLPGRPDIAALVAREQSQQVGAMCASVCGTGSLADEVRLAVRMNSTKSNIDFVENAFSW